MSEEKYAVIGKAVFAAGQHVITFSCDCSDPDQGMSVIVEGRFWGEPNEDRPLRDFIHVHAETFENLPKYVANSVKTLEVAHATRMRRKKAML